LEDYEARLRNRLHLSAAADPEREGEVPFARGEAVSDQRLSMRAPK